MRRHNLNLARRPFVNQRPVVRISGLLWGLGLVLLLLNVWLYWSFYDRQEQTRTELARLETAMDREQARIQELDDRLASVDLQAQNAQVAFLNQRIERRTFGWSVLFDTLAEVLPRDVRLTRLRPGRQQASSARRETAGGESTPEVVLSIDGQAKTHEDLYAFLDALIASPAFRAVNPQSEAQSQTGVVSFSLSTIYLPEQAVAERPGAEDSENEGPLGDGSESAEPGNGEQSPEAPEAVQQVRVRALPGGVS